MSEETNRERFRQVVASVLEQFAFMFAEDSEDAPAMDCEGDFLHVSINFSGRCQGVCSITAPESLCMEMAANVLGVDSSEAGSDAGEDALKELVNIVCGEAIATFYGTRDVFDLTVPSLCRIERGKWLELGADRETIRFWVDGKPFIASLMLVNA